MASITERPGDFVAAKNPVLYKITAGALSSEENYRIQAKVEYHDVTWKEIGSAIEIYPENNIALFNFSSRLLSVMDSQIKAADQLITYDSENNCVKYRAKFREAYIDSGGDEQATSWTTDTEELFALNGKIKPGTLQWFDKGDIITPHGSVDLNVNSSHPAHISFTTPAAGDEVKVTVSLLDYNGGVKHSTTISDTHAMGLGNLDLRKAYEQVEAEVDKTVEKMRVKVGAYDTDVLVAETDPVDAYLVCPPDARELRYKNTLGGYNTIYIHRELRKNFEIIDRETYDKGLLYLNTDTSITHTYSTLGRETMGVAYRFRGENIEALYELFLSEYVEVYVDGWKRVQVEIGNINYRDGDVYGTASFNLGFTEW